MTNEAKNVLNKTSELIKKSDFESAAKICKEFLANNPQNLKIWWNYILADCKASDEKGLAILNVDLKENPIFIEATEKLSDDKNIQLYKMEKKVASLIKANSGNATFNEYRKYFYESILEIKQDIETSKQELSKELQDNGTLFKSLKKTSASFYGNSPFGFMMLSLIFAIPFLFASILIKLFGAQTIVSLLPLFACLIIIIVRIIIRLLKQKKFAAEYAIIKERCELEEENLIEHFLELKELKSSKSKMMKIYKKFKLDTNVSQKKADASKKKFDEYFLGTGKRTK